MTEHRSGTPAQAPTPEEERTPSLLALAGGGRVAYRFLPGRAPTVVFLCGYASEMSGTKARCRAAVGDPFRPGRSGCPGRRVP